MLHYATLESVAYYTCTIMCKCIMQLEELVTYLHVCKMDKSFCCRLVRETGVSAP